MLGHHKINFSFLASHISIYLCRGETDLSRLINQATIDIEEPTKEDLKWMNELIGEFVTETKSVIGKRILDLWETEQYKFVKVFFFNLPIILLVDKIK